MLVIGITKESTLARLGRCRGMPSPWEKAPGNFQGAQFKDQSSSVLAVFFSNDIHNWRQRTAYKLHLTCLIPSYANISTVNPRACNSLQNAANRIPFKLYQYVLLTKLYITKDLNHLELNTVHKSKSLQMDRYMSLY